MMRLVSDEVLGLLSDGEAWTGSALSDRLGVSLRTVRRAVAALRESGVALDTDVGRGGGIRLGRHAGLPRLRLDAQEAISLMLALSLAESVRLPFLGAGLASLRNRLSAGVWGARPETRSPLRRRIWIGAPASEAVRQTWCEPRGTTLLALQQAFIGQRVVAFRYTDDKRRQTERLVEPQHILLNAPVWYLLAWDRTRGAGRTFRLDRVSSVQDAGESFRCRSATTLSAEVIDYFHPL